MVNNVRDPFIYLNDNIFHHEETKGREGNNFSPQSHGEHGGGYGRQLLAD
jgi:hypothetical protein